jgi:hypothetical protein
MAKRSGGEMIVGVLGTFCSKHLSARQKLIYTIFGAQEIIKLLSADNETIMYFTGELHPP